MSSTQPPSTPPTRIDVRFPSQGDELVGHLYLPAQAEEAAALPAVVVTGAWTSVKEQMAGRYAAELAARGFAALAFDFRGWGGSAGAPRFLEDPERKTLDVMAAAAFLAGRSEVDGTRVGGLGLCASAGYMVDAAARSEAIQAVALVAPWLHDADIVRAVYGGEEGVSQLVAQGRAAAAAEERVVITAASTTDEGSLMYQAPYYTEPERGLIPEYDNAFDVASWEAWLSYDALRPAAGWSKPLLAVHSQAAAIPDGLARFVERAGCAARVVWLDAVTQFDFYDQDAPVTRAADEVAAHLRQSFEQAGERAEVASVVAGVGALADLGEFEALEALYAPEVHVDYSSLSGAAAETKPAAQLMREWAGLLPGFEGTHHALSPVGVAIEGERARASATVVADHHLQGERWQVGGRYGFELERIDGAWRITSHAFELREEVGSRAILARAAEAATQRPAGLGLREQTEAAVRGFLECLESKDMQRFAELWAEDALQEMPFAPEGFPRRVSGRAALLAHYGGWPEASGAAEFCSKLQFHPLRDPHWTFATFEGRVEVRSTGRLYEQTYGGLFEVRGGQIRLFREYFDPVPFQWAFDLGGSTS